MIRRGIVHSQIGVRILNPQKKSFLDFSDFSKYCFGVRGFYKLKMDLNTEIEELFSEQCSLPK